MAPVPRRHFLYGLINSKVGLAGDRAPADPRLPSLPAAGRARTPAGTPGEDFAIEIDKPVDSELKVLKPEQPLPGR